MKTTIRHLAFIVLAAAAVIIPLTGGHDAFAQERSYGNITSVQSQTGTLGPNNLSDGSWVFVSGARPRLTVIAATRTTGHQLGTLAVYSQPRSQWIHWDSTPGSQKSMSQVVLPGWHYVRLYANGSDTTSYAMNIAPSDTNTLPDAGNGFDTARDLTLAPSATWHDRVDASDDEDFYRFTVPVSAPGRARFIDIYAANAFGGGATVELYRLDGNIANFVARNTTASLSQYPLISRQLAPATYFVRVSKNGVGTSYTLLLNSQDVAFDYGGTLENPASLGSTGQIFDSLHTVTDTHDLYWFQPNNDAVVNISIAKYSGDLKAYLMDEQRNIVATSVTQGNAELLSRALTGKGTYFVLLSLQGGDEAAYSILRRDNRIVTPSTPMIPSNDSPTDRNVRREIQRNNQFVYTRTETIGGADLVDWNFIQVPARSGRPTERRGFLIQATGLPAGATVALYSPTSSTPFDARTANAAGQIFFGATLPPGMVDVLVQAPAGSAPSTYTLTLSCTGGCPQ